LQHDKAQTVRDHFSAIDRLANLENRFERYVSLTHEAVASMKQAASDIAGTNHRQASLENRMESIEKSATDLKNQIKAGTQTTGKRVSRIASRQFSLENRMEPIENLTKATAADLQALQIAGGQAVRALVSTNGRQSSLERRVESIEKLTNVKMASELPQTATEQAARDLAKDRQASLENQTVGDLQQTATEMIAWELLPLVTATEQAARDRQASREELSEPDNREVDECEDGQRGSAERGMEQAARDLAKDRQACLENQKVGDLQQTATEMIAWELRPLVSATEEVAGDRQASREELSEPDWQLVDFCRLGAL